MSNTTDGVSRRNVLKTAGGSFAAVGVTGLAAADETDVVEVNVGYSAESGRQEILATATEVVRDFDSLDAVTIRAEKQAVSGLDQRADVRYTEENGTVEALTQAPPWGIDRVDADVVHGQGETANGTDIAILDTGIDSDHPDLQANIQGGRCFADNCCGEGDGLFCSTNDNTCNYAWDDDNDHGTRCAGVADAVDNIEGVVGVATEANLYAGKVLDACGSGSYSNIAAGIEWTANKGFDVASMAFGGDDSSVMRDAVQYAASKGVLLVAAAGNDGPCSDCVGYPAAYSEVIAVTAMDCDESLSDFSSTGSEVEFTAPGTDMYTAIPGGYECYSGTSLACSHVAGAASQVIAKGYSNPRERLCETAEDVGLSSNQQGCGLVDVAAALGYYSGDDGFGNDPCCSQL